MFRFQASTAELVEMLSIRLSSIATVLLFIDDSHSAAASSLYLHKDTTDQVILPLLSVWFILQGVLQMML